MKMSKKVKKMSIKTSNENTRRLKTIMTKPGKQEEPKDIIGQIDPVDNPGGGIILG